MKINKKIIEEKMNQEKINFLQEKLQKLTKKKTELTQELANTDNGIKNATQEIRTLTYEQDAKFYAENYEKFKETGDKDLYESALIILQGNMGNAITVKRGRIWDVFMRGNVQRFKVEKETGDVYHTGKHPKGNIIRDPPHILRENL